MWAMSQARDSHDGGTVGGTVFILEQTDDVGNPSGLVDAHWESSDPRVWRQGPTDVGLEVALSWAETRQAFVLITTAEGERYSAGAVPPDPLPPWLRERKLTPRLVSNKWIVHVSLPDPDGASTKRAIARLRESTDVTEESIGPSSAQITCVVLADSADEAVDRIDAELPLDLHGSGRDGYTPSAVRITVIGPAKRHRRRRSLGPRRAGCWRRPPCR